MFVGGLHVLNGWISRLCEHRGPRGESQRKRKLRAEQEVHLSLRTRAAGLFRVRKGMCTFSVARWRVLEICYPHAVFLCVATFSYSSTRLTQP